MGGRSTPRLIADAFGLYRRYPLLFLVLAAAVIVPFDLIYLAAVGSGGSAPSGAEATAGFGLSLVDLLIVVPLVSALHMHAVSDVRKGLEPQLGTIAKRGLATLPVVCAAAIMSGLGIFGGAVLFVIPGLYLWIRWFVVAQTAAIEHEGWTSALRRSWSLTEGSSLHVFVFAVCLLLIFAVPSALLVLGNSLVDEPSGIATFLAGTVLDVVLLSFTALATALLYYDLRERRAALAAESGVPERPSSPPTAAPVDHGIDPRAYSDEDRPNGWYVDPDRPARMLYWDDNHPAGWRGETRSPRKLRAQWEEENG
jgi:hypothetical protein